MSERVVIVGAGQAGFQVAVSLRQGGFDGRIVLLGGEDQLPYQRPPLSKQVLKGEWPTEKCRFRDAAFFEGHDIDFRPGFTATALDVAGRHVTLHDGRVLDFDHLAICTGSRLNRLDLAGSNLDEVHYLRTLDDAISIRERLESGPRLVVAGGGYIGLEVAASARQLGCDVTLIESQAHVMRRSALEPVADFLLERHRGEGVDVRLGRFMVEILGGRGVTGVTLDDGDLVECDMVLKGIGVRPELRWLEGSGIDTATGVIVDTRCRTSAGNVYAAGDVCEAAHGLFDGLATFESVQNAISQAKVVAANILGEPAEYRDVPWFWSDQYDCRFQAAGRPQPGDELVIRKGDPHSVSVLSLGPDRLNAIQCVNAPRDYMAGRKLIALRDAVPMDALRRPDSSLKDLI